MQVKLCFMNSVNERKISLLSELEHSLLFYVEFSVLGVLNILSRRWPAAVTEYKPKMQYTLIIAEPFPLIWMDMDTHAHTQLIN